MDSISDGETGGSQSLFAEG